MLVERFVAWNQAHEGNRLDSAIGGRGDALVGVGASQFPATFTQPGELWPTSGVAVTRLQRGLAGSQKPPQARPRRHLQRETEISTRFHLVWLTATSTRNLPEKTGIQER